MRLVILSTFVDPHIKGIEKNVKKLSNGVVYYVENFELRENKVRYEGRKFLGFSSGDKVFVRAAWYGAHISFWIKALVNMAERAGVKVIEAENWRAYPFYHDKYVQAFVMGTRGSESC